ncbi:MAG: hypothetical protein WC809_21975, partial [Sinimarinibacterium sp.]
RLSQSAAPVAIDIGMVVIQASIGVSIEACGAGLPAPMCRQMARFSLTIRLRGPIRPWHPR